MAKKTLVLIGRAFFHIEYYCKTLFIQIILYNRQEFEKQKERGIFVDEPFNNGSELQPHFPI